MTITMARRRPFAWLLALTLLVGTMSAFLDVRPAAAVVNSDFERSFVRHVNIARADRGLPRLRVASDLVTAARSHSRWMMRSGNFIHNAELTSDVTGWQMVGENIACGWSVRSLHRALMNSPGHRANILSPHFTQIGVGVHVDGSGKLWVTQVFRRPW